MKLFLLRHGEAGQAARDSLRELTPRGWLDASHIAGYLNTQPLPDHAWVSPLVRAQQTAEAVFRVCGRPVHVQDCDDLVPEADIRLLLARLEPVRHDLLLVGHNPLLSELLAVLSGQGRPPVLGTANLAVLDGELIAPACMRLLDIKSPGRA
ncbi:MAG: phosphohistidine phosphatase SixA [Gammaproteobacteria bacterium]|nr:MAG: phosphohistidine phosphatase SixA [Gammaproteobacteria bacterium]